MNTAMIRPEDLTIVFSGHNVEPYAITAIKSFLLFYPEYKSSINYFDDNSTDNTVEELTKLGIKVITWTKEFIDKYNEVKEYIYSKPDPNHINIFSKLMSCRVMIINNCICHQVNTKYLCFFDSDVIFYKRGLIENFTHGINLGAKVSTRLDRSMAVDAQYVDKYYVNNIVKDDKNAVKNGYFDTNLFSYRIAYFACMIDLEFFKERNIYTDRLDKRNIDSCYGGVVDTGTDFYCYCKEYDIQIYEQKETTGLEHFGFATGMTRSSKVSGFYHHEQNLVDLYYKKCKKNSLESIFEKISTSEYPLSIKTLIKNTTKNKYKSSLSVTFEGEKYE